MFTSIHPTPLQGSCIFKSTYHLFRLRWRKKMPVVNRMRKSRAGWRDIPHILEILPLTFTFSYNNSCLQYPPHPTKFSTQSSALWVKLSFLWSVCYTFNATVLCNDSWMQERRQLLKSVSVGMWAGEGMRLNLIKNKFQRRSQCPRYKGSVCGFNVTCAAILGISPIPARPHDFNHWMAVFPFGSWPPSIRQTSAVQF